MKILIVTSDNYPHVGGKSTHIKDLIDGLNRINVEVDIISFDTFNILKKNIYRIILIPIRLVNKDLYVYLYRRLWALELKRIVIKRVKKYKYSYISYQDAFAASAINESLINFDLRSTLTMHTYFGIENSLDKKPSKMINLLNNSYRNFEIDSLKSIDAVVAVDERIKKHIEDSIILDKIKLKSHLMIYQVANFTNIDNLNNFNVNTSFSLKHELGINENNFVICCLRRLVEKNGVINLVRAVHLLNDTKIILLIGGDGPQRCLIESYIQEFDLKNVKLLGSLNDEQVKNVYHISDISVVPSITVNGLQEATSISCIESMGCGLPTIASNIGGLRQLVKNLETGILVEEGSIDDLVQTIKKLKDNKVLYNFISENSKEYIYQNHSHIVAAIKYLNIFKGNYSNEN